MIYDRLLAEGKISFLHGTLSRAACSKEETIAVFPYFVDAIVYKSHHSSNHSFPAFQRINPTKLKYVSPVRYTLAWEIFKCEERKSILKTEKWPLKTDENRYFFPSKTVVKKQVIGRWDQRRLPGTDRATEGGSHVGAVLRLPAVCVRLSWGWHSGGAFIRWVMHNRTSLSNHLWR